MKIKEIEAYWRFCMHFDRHAKKFATDGRIGDTLGGGEVL
jgi:hypothetical protein